MIARDAIRRALETLSIVSPNEPTTADDEATGLIWLGLVLTDLAALPGMVPLALKRVTVPLSGALSYSIGPGQTWNYPVPTRLVSAAVTYGGFDSKVEIRDVDAWDRISDKTDSDAARWIRYEAGAAAGIVYVWPTEGESITLTYWHDYTPPAAANEDIGLPPRYDLAVSLFLAEVLAPLYSRRMPPEAAGSLRSARARLMAGSARRLTAKTKPEV